MSTLKELTDTTNTSFTWYVLGEDIVIDHKLNQEFEEDELLSLSQDLLMLFNVRPLLADEHISSFSQDVLDGIPKEGGAIPLDNIFDWLEYKELTAAIMFKNDVFHTSDIVSLR